MLLLKDVVAAAAAAAAVGLKSKWALRPGSMRRPKYHALFLAQKIWRKSKGGGGKEGGRGDVLRLTVLSYRQSSQFITVSM